MVRFATTSGRIKIFIKKNNLKLRHTKPLFISIQHCIMASVRAHYSWIPQTSRWRCGWPSPPGSRRAACSWTLCQNWTHRRRRRAADGRVARSAGPGPPPSRRSGRSRAAWRPPRPAAHDPAATPPVGSAAVGWYPTAGSTTIADYEGRFQHCGPEMILFRIWIRLRYFRVPDPTLNLLNKF